MVNCINHSCILRRSNTICKLIFLRENFVAISEVPQGSNLGPSLNIMLYYGILYLKSLME